MSVGATSTVTDGLPVLRLPISADTFAETMLADTDTVGAPVLKFPISALTFALTTDG